MLTDDKLDFWVKSNLNVLMIGEKGVGKTHLAIDTFKRNGLRYKYFSAPTLDPWCDVIGIPKEKKDKDGNSYLDFIQPKDLANDEVDVIFIDEISRGHHKVKNAILELVQFKSVNGRKFNNLRFVWAAMNPPDSSRRYQVEELDDAQWDRFQVHVTLDYKPDTKYFVGKFGADKGKVAIEWWNNIDAKFKHLVSPRRLDYALEHSKIGGDLRDILPKDVNVTELSKMLGTGPIVDKLKKIAELNDTEGAKKIIEDSNLYSVAEKYILTEEKYLNIFLPLISEEKLISLFSLNNNKINTFLLERVDDEKSLDDGKYISILRNIIKAKTSDSLASKARTLLKGKGVSEIPKPKNMNDEMAKISQWCADEPFMKSAVGKKKVGDSVVALFKHSYHTTDQSNAENLLAATLNLTRRIPAKKIETEFNELPDVAITLRNLIKRPVSLYKDYGYTEAELKAEIDRLTTISNTLQPF